MNEKSIPPARVIPRDDDSGPSFYSSSFQEHLDQLQRFRTLLDHANDIILLVCLDTGKIVDANASACRQLHYRCEMLIGMPVANIVDFESLNWPEDASGGCQTVLTRLQVRGGATLPVEILLCNEDFGGVHYVVIVARDITERLRAEEVLRKSEWEKALILESTQELIIYHDAELRIVWANRAAAESAQLTSEDLQSRRCWDIWHQRGTPCVNCPVVDSIRTGIPQSAEVTSPDGRVWLVRSYPTRDSEGVIEGAVELCLDITDRKRAEEALAKSRKQFRDMVESINDWVWEVDHRGVYTYASPQVHALLGYAPEEVIGKTPFDLMPETERAWAAKWFREITAKGAPFTALENINRHKDGHLVVLETSGVPFFDEEHILLGYRGVDRDVSVRKAAEKALRESDRMKTEFISTAAHELRTPLTSILGFSQILLNPETISAGEQKEFTRYIYQQAKALADMVADLLDIARIESGQGLRLRKELCTACELVSQLAPFVQSGPERGRFALAIADQESLLMIDKGKLVEVFENLLSNALKYSAPDSPIRIAGGVDGEYYRFQVADEGIGMTPEQVTRVFDKFYRADASNTAIGGLGLGMSIVRSIVETHDGRIWVESERGRGTTVHFILPMVASAECAKGSGSEKNSHHR